MIQRSLVQFFFHPSPYQPFCHPFIAPQSIQAGVLTIPVPRKTIDIKQFSVMIPLFHTIFPLSEGSPLLVQDVPAMEGDEVRGVLRMDRTKCIPNQLRVQAGILCRYHQVQGHRVALALDVPAADERNQVYLSVSGLGLVGLLLHHYPKKGLVEIIASAIITFCFPM